MDRHPVQEKLYEFCHLPGSNVSTYWRDVRTVITGDAETREPTPPPKGFPSIHGNDTQQTHPAGQPHTPGYHGDSPTPPQGLQSVPMIRAPESKTLICCETRPPNSSEELYALSNNNNGPPKAQARLLDRPQLSRQINRPPAEAVEEPTAWKREKLKRIDNALERVDKCHVRGARNFQESDVNERVDSQFMQPAPPTGPKPKVRKHNRVHLQPEKMLRENMRPGDVPGDPPDIVHSSGYSHMAYLTPATSYCRMPDQAPSASRHHTHILDHENSQSRGPEFSGNAAAAIPREMHLHRGGHVSPPVMSDLGREWHQDHHSRKYQAKERIQHGYVDDIRSRLLHEDETGPRSAQNEVELDIRRQEMLERKRQAVALGKAERLAASQLPPKVQPIDDQCRSFRPAPPSENDTGVESYSKRKRRHVHGHAHSVAVLDDEVDAEKGATTQTKPQLFLNASNAARVGLKSKQRREQENPAVRDEAQTTAEEHNRVTNTTAIGQQEQFRRYS